MKKFTVIMLPQVTEAIIDEGIIKPDENFYQFDTVQDALEYKYPFDIKNYIISQWELPNANRIDVDLHLVDKKDVDLKSFELCPV